MYAEKVFILSKFRTVQFLGLQSVYTNQLRECYCSKSVCVSQIFSSLGEMNTRVRDCFSPSSLLPSCWIETERKEAASRRAESHLQPHFWLFINCAVLWVKNGTLQSWTHSASRHSTEYKSINLNNNSEHSSISIFRWQELLCFFTQGQCFSALFDLHKAFLAIVLSPSSSGHVCGGVVRRWLSRNTEALKPNRETFPYCIPDIDNDIAIYDCCVERIWIWLHSKV